MPESNLKSVQHLNYLALKISLDGKIFLKLKKKNKNITDKNNFHKMQEK